MSYDASDPIPFLPRRAELESVPVEDRDGWPKLYHWPPGITEDSDWIDLTNKINFLWSIPDLGSALDLDSGLVTAFWEAYEHAEQVWDRLESEAWRRAIASTGSLLDDLPEADRRDHQIGAIRHQVQSLLEGPNFLWKLSLESSYQRERDALEKLNQGEVLARDALEKFHQEQDLIESDSSQPQHRKRTPKSQAPSAAMQAVCDAPNWPGDRRFHYAMTQIDRKDAWRTNQQEGLKYLPGSPHKTDVPDVIFQPTEIYPGEDWWSTHQKATLDALDQRFARIRGDVAADIADILFHHWSKTKKPNSSPTAVEHAAITLATICEYRGITTNKNNIELAYRALRDVRAFRLGGAGSSALFTVDELPDQLRLWEQDESPAASMIFVYAPGFFLAKAIEGEPFYTAPFMSRVWQLDPCRDAHAKRLARYLRGEWRMNSGTYLKSESKMHRFRSWGEVLRDAGISFDSYKAKEDPKRYIAGIHDAVETLRREGIIEGKRGTREDGWIYHPEDLPKLESLHSKRGILARWLALRVRIDPPVELCSDLAKIYASRHAWDKSQMQAKAQVKAKALAKAKKA